MQLAHSTCFFNNAVLSGCYLPLRALLSEMNFEASALTWFSSPHLAGIAVVFPLSPILSPADVLSGIENGLQLPASIRKAPIFF